MSKLFNWLKSEIVLVVASVFAIFSAFFVYPDLKYIEYIDFRVLALLFCLMIVVAGFNSIGLFDKLAKFITRRIKTVKGIILVMIMLCFFFGMIITNDVALIIFVPFCIMVLKKIQREDLYIPVIVLQTLGANMGSMLTPIGNPQNLYLYTHYNISIKEFLLTMLPVTAIAFVMLIISVMFIKGGKVENNSIISTSNATTADETEIKSFKKIICYITYSILFILCLLTVLRVLPYYITLVIVIIGIAIVNPKLFKKVDYMLLLTFIAFFIFVGNMGRIQVIKAALEHMIVGKEMLLGIGVSQIISNVPAALLLSNFTESGRELLLGVNIGSLGTLIASMASLISYKYYCQIPKSKGTRYMLIFTVYNIAYLAVYIIIYMFR